MNFIVICSLLVLSAICSLAEVTHTQKESVNSIRIELMSYLKNGLNNFTNSEKHHFKLTEDDFIAETSHAIVFKSIYTNIEKKIINQPVAIKIIWNKKLMFHERAIIKALNAANNPDIENHGIPRVYYQGPFLKKYNAIAMTLFDETLHDRYENNEQAKKTLTDEQFLTRFKNVVEGLKYLNSMHVVHNDIKPQNIFLRGDTAFISDFDLATFNGTQNRGNTRLFASAAFFGKRNRTSMDDLESLVYSMWYVSDVPMVRDGDSIVTEGVILNSCSKKEAEARVLKKCNHYQYPPVQEVMKFISVDQMLSRKAVPDYDQIIAKLEMAILTCQNSETLANTMI